MNEAIDILLEEIANECKVAINAHDPLNSAHESYAVIKEELDEFWEEVRKKSYLRSPYRMREELIQIAAMCIRTCLDLNLPQPGEVPE